MTFTQVIREGDDTADPGGVGPHQHDATAISGEATFITVRVNRLLAGTINGKEIVISGGTDGIIQSDGFVAGSAGWQILGDGSAEFQDAVIRGTLNADDLTAGTLAVARIAAKSLSVEKLLVGSVDNLIQNPGFETGVSTPWNLVPQGGSWSVVSSASSRDGEFSLRYDPAGQTASASAVANGSSTNTDAHPSAAEDDSFYIEAFQRTFDGSVWNRVRTGMEFRDESGVSVGSSVGAWVTPTTSQVKITAEGTAPAGSAYVDFFLQVENDGNAGRMIFDSVYARRRVGSVIFEADLQSDNFSTGSAGWQILRDTGNVEFNDGTFRGTVSAAAIIASSFKTASSGDRIEIDPAADVWAMEWYEGATLAGALGYNTTTNHLTLSTSNNRGLDLTTDSASALTIKTGSGGNLQLRQQDVAGDAIIEMSNGDILLSAGGASAFQITDLPRVISVAIRDDTTGDAANTNVNATGGAIRRSTSALKYKSRITSNVDYLADLEVLPTKHYRKDDKRWRYGLIADWLGDQDPLLGVYTDDGEIEDFDARAVLAVLAAKINRLEND